MQLNLTKSQLKTLLELTYLGNWMINAQRTGSKEDPLMQEHDDMTKFIYSKAGEAGLDKEVKYDEELKEWFPTQYLELESDVATYHDDYDEFNFLGALPERLASRDFQNTYGEAKINKMSFVDIIEKKQPFIEKYEDELIENGLERLVIEEGKSGQRLGRNEPCLCGSGKKYKKCCGN